MLLRGLLCPFWDSYVFERAGIEGCVARQDPHVLSSAAAAANRAAGLETGGELEASEGGKCKLFRQVSSIPFLEPPKATVSRETASNLQLWKGNSSDP